MQYGLFVFTATVEIIMKLKLYNYFIWLFTFLHKDVTTAVLYSYI